MKRRALSMLLVLVMVMTLLPFSAFAGITVGDLGEGSYNQILSKAEYGVAPGIKETDIVINNKQLTEQNMGYVMEIDMSNPSIHIVAGYKDYQGESWGMQTVRDQAAKAEAAMKNMPQYGENTKIVGAINANFFNMANGEPLGALVMNGKLCHNIEGNPNYGYFAVFKDGHAEIFRDNVKISKDIVEAMGGANILIEDGKVVINDGHDQGNRNPRSAVGIKADGTVVLYEVDGRQAPMSVGMTCSEMAEILKGMGCVDALLLDGGGSSTFCTRREGTDKLEVQNSLSDGNERTVSGTILVASTAAADGEFASAALTPRGKYYTPGSEVQFSAKGVDAAGYQADLPEGLVWALADEAAGTISADGLFTAAKDFRGEVQVLLKLGAKTVGSSTIYVQVPDALEFANAGLNLKYNEKKDLGLSAKYKGNDIIYKVGDIKWAVSEETISIGKNGETETVAAGYVDGNTFIANANNSLGNRSVESTVTATSAWDETVIATMKVGIGKAPVVVMDGGDNDGQNYENIPYVYAAPSGGGLVYESPYVDNGVDGDVILVHYNGRGGKSTAEQVNFDSGMVRFGEKALKINYDFTSITGTEGSCVGFDHDITIPGNPTGVGCWVYAPEGTPNLWVRIRVKDGTGTIQTLNFTSGDTNPSDGTKGGIDWSGWKYLECQFNDPNAGTNLVGPFTLMAGETIRIMAVPNNDQTKYMGAWVCQRDAQGNVPEPKYIGINNCKGCLYVDNLQLVYGANPADIDNPYIKTIKVGTNLGSAVEAESDGSTVIDDNTMMFYAEFGDVINENTSGVELVRVYVDGVNLTDKAVISIPDGKLTLDNITMANGEHTVEVLVRDAYGNEATLTRSFQVQQEDSALTSIQLTPVASTAVLGNGYVVSLGSNNMDDVAGVELSLKVGEQVQDAEVIFSDAFRGDYSFNNGVLTISAEKKAGAGEAEKIANIILKVRHDLPEHSTIQYKYSGSIAYADPQDGVLNTFAGTSKLIPINATYFIEVSKSVVDGDPCVITVTDRDGRPVKGASIYTSYAEDAELVGVTKANGKLSTYLFGDEATDITPYAVKEENGKTYYSFAVKTMSYTAVYDDALPHAIQFNSTVNGATGKNISWLTNPLLTQDKAVMLYATKAAYEAEGEAAFVTAEGSVKATYFDGDKKIANANGVVVTGLTPSTTYVYKVGDGLNWSAIGEFTTEKAGQDATNFFIVADTQLGGYGEDGYVRMDSANKQIGNLADNYTFGIHVGDAVESANKFDDWDTYFKHFNTGAFGSTDVIHIMGNHEAFSVDVGENIYNTNHRGYYSVDNGCVYVAVIDYTTDKAELTKIAEWLKEDAAASSADWKFVATHAPVYYTNVTAKQDLYIEVLAPVCDEIGIDAVFSGHDHAFARTYPMIAGEIDETLDNPDKGNGTVYYVCGTLGGKYYSGTDTPEFHFATLRSGENGNLDRCAVFLVVNADKNNLSISAYDYYGNLVDQYTKTRKDDCDNGHEYSYNPDTGLLTCSACGIEVKAEDSGFTGFASFNGTEDQVYFKEGVIQTGFITYGTDVYHACGENNIAHKCDVKDTRTCTQNGYKQFVCPECSEYQNGEPLFSVGHVWDEDHVCEVCGFHGINIATVDVPEKTLFYTYTGKAIKPNVDFLTYEGETLNVRSSRKGTDGYASYTNNVDVGMGTITVEGRGNFYGTLDINFVIIPGSFTTGEANDVTADSATLSWAAAPGATKYCIERYSVEKNVWIKIGTTESTTYDLLNLKDNTEYLFRISWQADAGEKSYFTSADKRLEISFTTIAHEHGYSAVVTAPTCTEKGYTTHTCTICGDSYVDSYVDALGHDFGEWKVTTAPTCTEKGVETRCCSRCDATETRDVEVLDHEYKAVVTAPTCTEKGCTTHTCTLCGDSYVDSYVDALGHDFGEWKVTTAPTCTEKGVETHSCSRCDVTETREVAALDHDFGEWKVTTAPTCTEKGAETHSCSRCDVTETREVAALDHDFGEWKVTTAPTCTEKGVETRCCSRCDVTETRDIAVIDHNTELINEKAASCTEDGYTGDEVCKICNKTIKSGEVIPALGHEYKDGKCVRCGEVNNPFTDIGGLKQEMQDAILWAYYHEPEQITSGFTATEFRPNNDCTRGQVVTFLWRAAGCPEPESKECPFKDVHSTLANGKDNPYYEAILWATENGITTGYNDGTFRPNDSVTRAQFVTFLWRYEGKPATSGSIAGFTDASSIAEPYQQAVAWAVEKGITTGYNDGSFRPNATCTRWAVVLFMYRDMA